MDREFYPDLPSKTAVLLYTLSKSQACPDGNKRIAVILAEAFLALNQAMLVAGQDELASQVLAAAKSDRTEREAILRELTGWLGKRITRLAAED